MLLLLRNCEKSFIALNNKTKILVKNNTNPFEPKLLKMKIFNDTHEKIMVQNGFKYM